MTDADLQEIDQHQFTGPLQAVRPPNLGRRAVARVGGKVWFRAGWTCPCVAKSLPQVEQELLLRGLIRSNVDIYQLGYRNDVSASAGTHGAGGNTDVGQFSSDQIDVWRQHGWTIQHRTTGQGFSMDHGHGWPLGCTHLSAAGDSQWAQWRNRQNGLMSRGPVQGRWPIDTWTTAYDKRKKVIMALADDIASKAAAATAAKLGGQFARLQAQLATVQAQVNGVPASILNKDGLIVNEYDPASPNKTLSLKTALGYVLRGNRITNSKLDQIVEAVKK